MLGMVTTTREKLHKFFKKPLPRFFFCIGLPIALLWICVSIVFYKIIEDWTWVQATFYSVNVFMGVYVFFSQHVIETTRIHKVFYITGGMDIQFSTQITANGSRSYIQRSVVCA